MAKSGNLRWAFAPRFRRHAFGWKSQPAIQRIKEAVSEIERTARKDPVLAAEGAVLFLEKVSPALESVDSSSGAIGTTVNRAIAVLVRVIANAPADATTRARWLERLWDAHAQDEIPYIEALADYWGEVCASPEVASEWADRLVDVVRLAWSSDPTLRGHFRGTPACLSALHRAGRHPELIALLERDRLRFWPYQHWGVKALAAMGKRADAIRYAESCRGPYTSDCAVAQACEEVLLGSGLIEEAYARYAIEANQRASYLDTFRAVVRKYPHIQPAHILRDLVASTPGDEGKWFAAAKEAKLYDDAVALAKRSPCDPRTLTRAARDFGETNPGFAVEAGMAALYWLTQGYGYEITGADVWAAYSNTRKAAEHLDRGYEVTQRIRQLVAGEAAGDRFVTQVLGRELGLT